LLTRLAWKEAGMMLFHHEREVATVRLLEEVIALGMRDTVAVNVRWGKNEAAE
jgi:hypothetical protein